MKATATATASTAASSATRAIPTVTRMLIALACAAFALAMALGYTSEIKNLFATPKYTTMEELTQIRKNTNKKKAYKKQ